ncbi:MAG TPA: COX15/CtaA family protein [Tepidisphaeraceae bacterium]
MSHLPYETPPAPGQPRYHRALHVLALLTACATFPLIFMGGLVTSHQAGMSVPDWPNSYGYNMFLFPPRLWIGGILYEHTHRLMGTVVGLLSILLAAVAWRVEERRPVRWLAIGVLGAVIFQGVLGGLRVVLVKLDLAIVHACFAQAFFCLAALVALVTSRGWIERSQRQEANLAGRGRALVRLAIVAVVMVYLQLVVGAVMRHYQAGLAIPDFPLSYGKVLPPTDAAALQAANAMRHADVTLNPVTIGQVWIHFAHRIGALLVTMVIVGLAGVVIRKHRKQPELMGPAIILVILLIAQITLGIVTVLWRKPADVASAHVAVGALVLLTAFVLCVRAIRLDGMTSAAITVAPHLEGSRTGRPRGITSGDESFSPVQSSTSQASA